MFMLRLRHASHFASHRTQREPLNLKAELGVILYDLVVREDAPIFTSDFSVRQPLKTPPELVTLQLGEPNSETPTPASPPPTKSVIYAALGLPPGGDPLDFPDTPQGACGRGCGSRNRHLRRRSGQRQWNGRDDQWRQYASVLPSAWSEAACIRSSVFRRSNSARCSAFHASRARSLQPRDSGTPAIERGPLLQIWLCRLRPSCRARCQFRVRAARCVHVFRQHHARRRVHGLRLVPVKRGRHAAATMVISRLMERRAQLRNRSRNRNPQVFR